MLILFAGLLVFFCGGGSVVAASTFAERIQTDARCHNAYMQLSPGGLRVVDAATRLSERLGLMPSYPEFLRLLAEATGALSGTDQANLFELFGAAQRPAVSTSELAELIVAQRASLSSVEIQYQVQYIVENPSPESALPAQDVRTIFRFARDGTSILLGREYFRGRSLEKSIIEAYDGRVVRGSLRRPGAADFSWVNKLDSRRRFFEPGNPLFCAKLLDQAVELQAAESEAWEDLATMVRQSFVYETPVDVNGIKCVVVGNENMQVFCSPELGYAVVEQRNGDLIFDRTAGHYVHTGAYWILMNSDFITVSGKVSIPQRSEFRWIQDGRLVEHRITTVDRFDESPVFLNDTFSDIIAKDAYVADTVQNLSYINHTIDIESQLRSLPCSASWVRRSWLVGVNILTVLGALVLMYYRRNRRQAERKLSR